MEKLLNPEFLLFMLIPIGMFTLPIILGRIVEEPEEKQRRKQRRINRHVKIAEFTESLLTAIRSAGRDAEIDKDGSSVIIDKAIGLIPPSDIDSLYDSFKQGFSVSELKEKLLDLVVFKKKQIGKYTNFETEYFLRDQLTLRLMNIERHRNELKNLVYSNEENDIAICIAYLTEDENGLIDERLIDKKTFRPWMWRQAYLWCSSVDPPLLYEIPEDEDEIEDEPENLIESRRLDPFKTYILTNKEQYLGASVLFYNGIQDRIYDLLGECFLIPLSVHRWLIIPVTPYTKPKCEEYVRLLKEDNRNAKYPELVLSDNVYMYDGELLMQVSEGLSFNY